MLKMDSTRQSKLDSKKKQSNYSIYSSKHVRISAELKCRTPQASTNTAQKTKNK